MSFAVGQPVPVQVVVYDDTGVPADATTVVLTVTLPDGTTVTPSVSHPDTGVYQVDYVPTVHGLHTVQWTMTGINQSAPPVDVFYVDPVAVVPLVSLAEARQQCRIGSTADDPILQRFMRVASDTCERRTQIWRRTTFSTTRDGGGGFVRLRAPVIEVISVLEDGTSVSATGYVLDSVEGRLYRGTSSCPMRWNDGRRNIIVEYVAGAADGVIPEPIRQGVLLLVEHLWNTQRGGANLPRNAGAPDWALPVGFTLPNAVLEEWDGWMRRLVA